MKEVKQETEIPTTRDQIESPDRYFMLPNEFFTKTATIYESMVLVYLKRCANLRNQSAFPSYETLAKKCHCDRRTAIRAVKSLIEKKLIEKLIRYEKGKYTSNLYMINLDELEKPSVTSDSQSLGGDSQSLGSDSQSPNKETPIKKHLKRNSRDTSNLNNRFTKGHYGSREEKRRQEQIEEKYGLS